MKLSTLEKENLTQKNIDRLIADFFLYFLVFLNEGGSLCLIF